VSAAREVVAQTVEWVGAEHRRFFRVEAFLWENEAMLASGHFQDSIEPPSKFDMVILLLGSRLGTPLPERTALREYHGIDGRAPVTGTEWEFEEALAAARDHGAPDLLVYRSRQDVKISSVDLAAQAKQLAQLEALNAFWTRHFEDRGAFLGAYSRFDDLEQLARAVEKDLGALIKRRIEAMRLAGARPAAVWVGDPFRGLEPYGFEHAPIYCGRTAMVGKAMLQLLEQLERGRAFLLVCGASGSGKSSLAQAGIAPRLFEPRRLPGAAVLRRVVFRPRETGDDGDLFAALARRLVEGGAPDVGLPELAGPAADVAGLAEHLRQTYASPGFAFTRCLDDLAAAARKAGRMLDYQQPKLLLIVDQLEELFTLQRIAPDDRARFAGFLAGLAASGQAIVIATLRSDMWGRAAELPELVRLAEGAGRLDLAGPSPAEIGQMIRLPAAAAGLGFEPDADTGLALDERIAEDAAHEADALPLLSHAMDALYRQAGPAHQLGYAAYRALGGLSGAIATRADAVLAAQGPEARAALAGLLFALVQLADGDRPTARPAPLASFPPQSAERLLISALAEARLLVLDTGAGGAPVARLAHEALLSHWGAARDGLAAQAQALRARAMVEAKLRRFRELPPAAPGKRVAGLLAGVDLTDAQALVGRYGPQLGAELVDFVQRSAVAARKARRAMLVRWSAVAAGALLLVAGGVFAVRSALAEARHAALLQDEKVGEAFFADRDYQHALEVFRANERRAQDLIAFDGAPKYWLDLAIAHARAYVACVYLNQPADAAAELAAVRGALAETAARDAGDAGSRRDRVALQAWALAMTAESGLGLSGAG
jgi:hypothetical protein